MSTPSASSALSQKVWQQCLSVNALSWRVLIRFVALQLERSPWPVQRLLRQSGTLLYERQGHPPADIEAAFGELSFDRFGFEAELSRRSAPARGRFRQRTGCWSNFVPLLSEVTRLDSAEASIEEKARQPIWVRHGR